jgi:hypothetical protein
MKKLKMAFVCILCIFILTSGHIAATPGKLRTNSIISCNGIYYGNHGDGHWHIAVKHDSGWYPSGGSLGYDNPCASNLAPPEVKKNNDTSLRLVTIDNHTIEVQDTMHYVTTNDWVSIHAIPTNDKTSIIIPTTEPLQIGTNYRTIIATAEDGSSREYELRIVREKIKSSNSSLHSIIVDSDTIVMGDIMEYTTGNRGVSIDAVTEDSNASVTINYNLDNLRVGLNEIPIKVIAEDGSINEYKLHIKRLNDDIGIDVAVNGHKVTFDGYESHITVRNNIKEIDVDYVTNDTNASVELNYEETLQDGNNNISIYVTAENGNRQEYSIVVKRKSLRNKIVSTTVMIAVLILIASLVMQYIKYKKRSNKIDITAQK